MSGENLVAIIPIALFAGALLAPLCRRGAREWPYWICLFSVAIALAASVAGWLVAIERGEAVRHFFGGWAPPIGIELVLDPLSGFFCILITGISLFMLWHGKALVEWETPGKQVPFYSAVLLLIGGLAGMVLTGDLFNLYVFLEISSLAGYALVAIGDKRAPMASFRYLILGTVGASFYLLGVGFLMMITGSLNMAELQVILSLPEIGQSPAVLSALALIVLGLGLKMAMFPLHGWLADAYTYSSSVSTAIIAPIGTKVAAYVLIRTLFHIYDPEVLRTEMKILDIIAYLGAAGIIWGSLLAMAQKNLKRMLACSSIGHVGYLALGIGLASPLGLIGALLHALNHAVMKGCLFLVCGSLLMKVGHLNIDKMDNTLRKKMPWTMAAFTLAALSMIGLPPTAGFFSKWYLVWASVEQQAWLLVVAILVSSLMSAVYFFRVIERIYLRPYGQEKAQEEPPVERAETSWSMLAPILILSASLLLLGLGNFAVVRYFIMPILNVS